MPQQSLLGDVPILDCCIELRTYPYGLHTDGLRERTVGDHELVEPRP
jgi:hypothetical protein